MSNVQTQFEPFISGSIGARRVSGTPRVSALSSRNPGRRANSVDRALMNLSEHPVNAAVETSAMPAANNPPVEMSEAERRAYPRRDSGNDVLILRQAEMTPGPINWSLESRLRGKVVDVSLGSVAFAVPVQLPAGERLSLRIVNHQFHKAVEVAATVLRTTPLGPNEWRTICRFQHKLDYAQVHFLGRQPFPSQFV